MTFNLVLSLSATDENLFDATKFKKYLRTIPLFCILGMGVQEDIPTLYEEKTCTAR